jgi:outer membrane cobalamin receptor
VDPDPEESMRARHFTLALVATLTLTLAGCAGMKAGERPDGAVPGAEIITREDIARTGARDAFEALQRSSRKLLVQDTGFGNRPRVTNRGVGSFVLEPSVAIVVDGVRLADGITALRGLPANDIAYMQVLTARQATPRMGSTGGNGAVLVTTGALPGGAAQGG